jgi:ABC-type hemin transport system ATPase subunit
VLDAVSLSVEAGELISLIGRRGCGKRTFKIYPDWRLRPRSGPPQFRFHVLHCSTQCWLRDPQPPAVHE